MEEKPKKSKALSWFIGCLAALVVFGILCAGGSWLACHTLFDKAIQYGYERMVEVVEESELPQEQVSSMKSDLRRLRDAALGGEVDFQRMEGLEEEMGRLITLGALHWFAVEVVENSALPPQEAQEAKRTIERFARGIQEGKLHADDLERFQLRNEQSDGEREWDIEDTRRTIAEMREEVDEAGIPDEPFQADVAKEFTQLIDELIESGQGDAGKDSDQFLNEPTDD
ncbi:MAG: hypothetical protein CMJ89_01525 [Planctomycetes bacterium]|jgi:hypothetical protein|nr:hypothetical protein [Planctomycetota bacterium]